MIFKKEHNFWISMEDSIKVERSIKQLLYNSVRRKTDETQRQVLHSKKLQLKNTVCLWVPFHLSKSSSIPRLLSLAHRHPSRVLHCYLVLAPTGWLSVCSWTGHSFFLNIFQSDYPSWLSLLDVEIPNMTTYLSSWRGPNRSYHKVWCSESLQENLLNKCRYNMSIFVFVDSTFNMFSIHGHKLN